VNGKAAGAGDACWIGVEGVCFRTDFAGRGKMKTRLSFAGCGGDGVYSAGSAFAQQAAPAASAPPDCRRWQIR